MGSVWKTKYGMRRVRVDPPTLEEALYAAEGLTPDTNEQLQIAAQLMDLNSIFDAAAVTTAL